MSVSDYFGLDYPDSPVDLDPNEELVEVLDAALRDSAIEHRQPPRRQSRRCTGTS